MPTDLNVLGFSNRWYIDGVTQATVYQIDELQSIRIFSAPYFIAAKLEAYKSFRHGRDPRMNSDFEDIIYLFDNRNDLIDEIIHSPNPVRSYLQQEIAVLYQDPTVNENIYAHLERSSAVKRTERILKIWQKITAM